MMVEEEAHGDEPRQADIIVDIKAIPVLDKNGQTQMFDSPHGVAVVTQCCDLAREGKGMAQLAPICKLGKSEAGNARAGRSPRYVGLPELGDDYFIDLGILSSGDHALLRGYARVSGVSGEEGRHRARQRIGRKFARFAFPDDLVPMFSVLQKEVRKAAGKANSDFGEVLDKLAALRVEISQGWDSEPPWDVTLLMIVNAGILPSAEQDFEESDVNDLGEVCRRLLDASVLTSEMAAAWEQLRKILLEMLDENNPGADIVVSLNIEVLDEEEFSYYRYKRTVALDLEDLSDPVSD